MCEQVDRQTIDRLMVFFESNPYTINTVSQLCIRLGLKKEQVENALEHLVDESVIQKICYPDFDVYRYIPLHSRK